MLLVIALALVGWTLYSVVCLVRNIRRIQKIGIPYHVIPCSPVNPLWILLEPVIFFILGLLPFEFGRITHYGRRTWQFTDKAQSHMRMGDAWAIATPNEVFVYICDADAITDIIARRADFVRPIELFTLLNVFGPNVATTEGADWQRHRKIVAAPFNESLNSFVWREALTQARSMLASRTTAGPSGGLGTDTRTLALNVLAATGFKRSTRFQSAQEAQSEDPRSYAQSLKTVMLNTFVIMLVPPTVLKLPIFPSWCRSAGQAVEDFKQHMLNMFNTEKALLDQGQPGTGTLMSSFVRESTVDPKSNKTVLTIDEILGNIYVINFAGHDTTAGSLTYVLFLLAAYPHIQDWIAEEIRTVFPNPDRDTWDYKEAFPRLKRCLAVVLETVRLYPPILALPKSVAPPTTSLRLPESNRTIVLPKGTVVLPSLLAAQTHPKYWPDEPTTWNPRRWVETATPSGDAATTREEQLAREEIMEPRAGAYFPWSAGVQNCAGRKFAQVEIVAAMAALFREYRMRPVLLDGEDFEKAQARILKSTNDSYQLLVMQMRDPDSTQFVWEKVE
ncbi:cytochrome P450 [Aspergillus pseudonomiae]|uniref:Cytochrome P450 n=1 Tax=Aspergillus pseudonomiae TaxID=1506151 RepID=A0A5N6ID92_9EURO|nr:cytochrome P450 [Aspergillus pseudonomiae]KAB8264692.1 cytochrome P450 [Aspergillus pseudonomiae]KAE8401845.1 cytochrome P450 [Aspergillus pseudonomiae]